MLTLAVQQSDSAMRVCVCVCGCVFNILFHYGLSQDTEGSAIQ